MHGSATIYRVAHLAATTLGVNSWFINAMTQHIVEYVIIASPCAQIAHLAGDHPWCESVDLAVLVKHPSHVPLVRPDIWTRTDDGDVTQ